VEDSTETAGCGALKFPWFDGCDYSLSPRRWCTQKMISGIVGLREDGRNRKRKLVATACLAYGSRLVKRAISSHAEHGIGRSKQAPQPCPLKGRWQTGRFSQLAFRFSVSLS
jgi:hypothetical protein